MPDTIDRRELLGLGAIAAGAAVAVPAALPAQAGASSLAGKSVLITGCSSGFGRLTAMECARRGAKVFATMRNLKGGGRPEAKELSDWAATEKLRDFAILELDVTSDAQVVAAIAAAEAKAGGRLDAVVNNAGIGLGGPVELADIEAMQSILNTNLLGYLRVARAALPAMRKAKQGLVVCVSSQLGRITVPNLGIYGSTKFAVEGMFETMAYELAPFGVEIAIVQPGGFPTNIWKSGAKNSQAMLERQAAATRTAYDPLVNSALAMGERGGGTTDPNDVARAIADLVGMAPGSRPLRRPVHPNTRATDAVNAACAQVQAAVLGTGPYADWHRAVTS